MNHLTDEQLVEAYLKGDRAALDLLIRRYLTPIFNYALSFVKEPSLAEDISQEVFIKVWKKIRKFDSRYKFKNWLYTIAKNTCLDYFKKNKTINFSEFNLNDDNLLFEELIRETSPSPLAELEMAQSANLVNTAVDRLPEKYKTTIKLRYHEGYKFREIAEMMNRPIETVKSWNRRALMLLRQLIKK